MKRVLIVDDEPDILKIVIFRLKKAGYEVLTADNGKEALDIIRKTKVDLIVLDLIMPVLDGYELSKIIKSDKDLAAIPIIILSASAGRTAMEDKIKELKAEGYVLKPFDPDRLLSEIEKVIG